MNPSPSPAPPVASHEPTAQVSVARWWLEEFARGPQHMGYIQGIRDKDWAQWAQGAQSEVIALLSGKPSAAAPVAPVQPVAHDLLEAVDSMLETAPCECSDKRRHEQGEHLSHCYLFDLNIARGRMLAAQPQGDTDASKSEYWCNKCGAWPDTQEHNRPDGSRCPYIARKAP